MKQLWIEKQAIEQHWIDFFGDFIKFDNLKIVEQAAKIPQKDLIADIQNAEIICFVSSFAPSSCEFLEPLMKFFLDKEIKGKTIYCGGDFLHSLQANYFYEEDTSVYKPIFENNTIMQMEEGFKRIVWKDNKYNFENN